MTTERSGPPFPDLAAAVSDSLARFAADRERTEKWIAELENLGEVPILKLRRFVQRTAAEHPLPMTAALLTLARKSRDANPRRMRELSQLSLFFAQRSPLPERVKQALSAEAEALTGDSWRQQGKLHEAERAFGRAARHLEEAGDPYESANFCRLLADLRQDQRRFEEALALRDRAASLFAEVGQTDDQAQALLDKAGLEMKRDEVERALSDLRAVIALADQGLRPDLAAMGVAVYGKILCQSGRATEALTLVRAFRERSSTLPQEEPGTAGLCADERDNEN